MNYTFQISDKSKQSKSIINMLLSLSKDYDFLKVVSTENEDEENDLTIDQELELDRRYDDFIKKPRNGKTWSEVKKTL